MKEIKARGLCVKSIDYAENDKLVTLYLFGIGKVLCRAKGIRKPKAKLRFAAMPMTVADFIVLESNGYYTLKTAEIVTSHSKLWQDIESVYLASVMLELLDKFALEGDRTDDYFTTVCDFLDEAETKDPITAVNKYIAEFLKYGGYELKVNKIDLITRADIFYSPGSVGFNFSGVGVKADLEVYDAAVKADNFIDTDRLTGVRLLKLIVYHIEALTDIKLRSASEYFCLVSGAAPVDGCD